MALPGETEAWLCGDATMPRDMPGGLVDTMGSGGADAVRHPLQQNPIGEIDPHALRIPARRAEYSLTENARFPISR